MSPNTGSMKTVISRFLGECVCSGAFTKNGCQIITAEAKQTESVESFSPFPMSNMIATIPVA